MFCGGPTDSAAPLLWAHSEYLRLLRSRRDGKVFDLITEVERRYGGHAPESHAEFWLPMHPISCARRNCLLRICAPEQFRLRWTQDNWTTWSDDDSHASGVGAEFLDLPQSAIEAGVEFTFFWKSRDRWEGRNYKVKTI